jgi:Domain of unknown function (DUF4160)
MQEPDYSADFAPYIKLAVEGNIMSASWKYEFHDTCIDSLGKCLDYGPIEQLAEEGDGKQEIRFIQKGLFAKLNGLKIYIYSEEHPPPHFHVIYNDEENSFSILDASPLYPDGQLFKYFKNIKKWHKKHKEALANAWNKSRPSDCPVGRVAC